jgi:hypothetical protein
MGAFVSRTFVPFGQAVSAVPKLRILKKFTPQSCWLFPGIFAVFFIDNQRAHPKNRLMDQPKFRPARMTLSASMSLPIRSV